MTRYHSATDADLEWLRSPQAVDLHRRWTRRHLLRTSACGLGAAALAGLEQASIQAGESSTGGNEAGDGLPHHPPQAKRAIYLFMSGGPSQVDLWDPKPGLQSRSGQELPDSIRRGQRLTTMTSGQTRLPVAPSRYQFRPHGQSGTMISELLPHLATKVDEMAVIRSMQTDAINHDPAVTSVCTGSPLPGKASLGAWLSYGLGSDSDDLPAFVVMTADWSGRKPAQALYHRLWGSGFLPSRHQGVMLRNLGDPVLYLANPQGLNRQTRRRMLDALGTLNRQVVEQFGDPDTEARIAQYELAFRMQTSVPELTDLSDEPQHVLDLYGPDVLRVGSFAYSCLMARRLAERGVRLTQIFHRGWDQHDRLADELPKQCRDIDRPAAGLLTDLRQRGLLDDTLVVWGGEFGRTVYCQGDLGSKSYGRDHHPRCFSVWLAGAGIRGGTVHGETDEYCYNVVRDPVHVRDLNATILHQLGIDAKRFTFMHQGLEQRLVGVEPAEVVKEILRSG